MWPPIWYRKWFSRSGMVISLSENRAEGRREMSGAEQRVACGGFLGNGILLTQRLCVGSHRTNVVSSNFYVTARTSARGSWRRSGYVTALVHNTPVAA